MKGPCKIDVMHCQHCASRLAPPLRAIRPLPSFKGKFVVNEETGQEQYVYHEFGKRYLKLTISWIISLMFIFGTITCAVGTWCSRLFRCPTQELAASCLSICRSIDMADCAVFTDALCPALCPGAVATFLKTLGEGTPDDASLLQKNKWKIISATANLLIIQVPAHPNWPCRTCDASDCREGTSTRLAATDCRMNGRADTPVCLLDLRCDIPGCCR